MTIAYWCVFVAVVMPYALTLFAKRRMPLRENRAPRVYKAGLTGASQRAVWAEANHFESFPTFAAAVIIAHLTLADQIIVDGLALAYIASRVAYNALYLADRSTLRSVAWFSAFGCILGLFIAGAVTGAPAGG